MLGPEVSYISILNHGTRVAIQEEQGKKKFHPLRPSSSGKCTRELAYSLEEFLGWKSYPKEAQTPELTRLFDLGHHIERHSIQQFEKYGAPIELRYKQQVLEFYRLEAKKHPELSFTLEGSLDSCFFTPGFKGVIDFKSKKDKFSKAEATHWDETTTKLKELPSVEVVSLEPAPYPRGAYSEAAFWVESLPDFLNELNDPFFEDNFLQLNGYACTQFLRDRGVDHAAIIQYCKNDSRLREVRFKPSMELFYKVRDKFQAALTAVDEGDLEKAPRDFALGSMKCKFCPYRDTCWGQGKADTAFFENLPPKVWPTDSERLGETGAELENLFGAYHEAATASKEMDAIQAQIVVKLAAKGVKKIRLGSGAVYEVKQLKDGAVLRRSKA